MNFNMLKNMNNINNKNKEEPTSKNNKNNDLHKNMLKFVLVVVGAIVILFVVVFVFSLFTKKNYDYDDLEVLLEKAAQSYFKDHPQSLPQTEDQIIEIDAVNLASEEKMKDLSEYTKEGISCAGQVQVEKVGSEYLYTPYLNCGEHYVTTELYKKIAVEDNVVDSGYGLYYRDGIYYFRGESVNNYVKLDKALWRIVKVTADNNIVLIKDSIVEGGPVAWDDRYNEEKRYTAGINIYSASRIREKLYAYYKEEKDEKISFLSKNDKTKMISYNACTGKRAINETRTDNVVECSEVLENQKVGLLTLSDYMSASIDQNCKSSLDATCQNYNYLTLPDDDWWLITSVDGTTSETYAVGSGGAVENANTSGYSRIRPVIYLNSKVLYKDGKGTKSKPYTIK